MKIIARAYFLYMQSLQLLYMLLKFYRVCTMFYILSIGGLQHGMKKDIGLGYIRALVLPTYHFLKDIMKLIIFSIPIEFKWGNSKKRMGTYLYVIDQDYILFFYLYLLDFFIKKLGELKASTTRYYYNEIIKKILSQ